MRRQKLPRRIGVRVETCDKANVLDSQRINSYKRCQCIQRDPSGSRPHDLEDWQELIGAIEFALDRDVPEPHVFTSLMSSSQKFTLFFACYLLKFAFLMLA